MGLILTGDQKLADGILEEAFQRARPLFAHHDHLSEWHVFRVAFHAFDDAVHRKGVVVILDRASKQDGSLGNHVNDLSYLERLAIALLLVEKLSPAESAALSERPAPLLETALMDAMNKLETRNQKSSAND